MLSAAIFQPEITTLESQIAQLQAQIAQAEQRITHLNEAETIAFGAIVSLQTALQKVSTLAPDALASLKSSVLELFTGDTSNQPIEPSSEPAQEPELNGQYSDFAVLSSDAPEVEQPPFVELVQVSDRVAYQRRHDERIPCCYVGSNNKGKIRLWGEWLAVHRTVANGFEVREAKRLTHFKHELKLWGMSLVQIEQLAECDFSKDPSNQSNPFKDAPKLLLQKVAPVNQPATVEELSIGDIVASRSVSTWTYRVLEVKSDGNLDCEKLGCQPPLRLGLHVKGVTLVSKSAPTPTEAEVEEELEALVSIQPPDSPVSAVSGYSSNPIGRRGATANWKASQASGRKLDLNPNFDSMQKWRDLEAEQNALAAIAEPDF